MVLLGDDPGDRGERGGDHPKPLISRGAMPARLSITDFLSDGSLVRLCAELTVLTGVRVDLLDVAGRAVQVADPGWSVAPSPLDEPIALAIIDEDTLPLGAEILLRLTERFVGNLG